MCAVIRQGGEIAMAELEHFVSSRIAFNDAKGWSRGEICAWVKKCESLKGDCDTIIEHLYKAEPPIDGEAFLSFGDSALKTVRKQLANLSLKSANHLKLAVREGFGRGIPARLLPLLRQIFSSDPICRPHATDCAGMLLPWRDCLPPAVTGVEARSHSQHDISRTLRNLGAKNMLVAHVVS